MAITNRDRVGKALELLGQGLAPFVERELKSVLGAKWQDALTEGAPHSSGAKKRDQPKLADPYLLLGALWNQSNNVFSKTLGHAERSLVSELRDIRNRWALNET